MPFTCNCPKCGAKHQKRKTPPTVERDIDIINLTLNGNSKAQIACQLNLTYDRIRQITNSAQMDNITKQLDTGITKLQELKNRVARYKRIETAAKSYTDLRLKFRNGSFNSTSNRPPNEEIEIAFEQLLESIKSA